MSIAAPVLHSKKIAFDQLLPGYTIFEHGVAFRFFSPLADEVSVEVFNHYEQTSGETYSMSKDDSGFWNYFHPDASIVNKWYGYHIRSHKYSPFFENTEKIIADPWSKLVTSRNHYLGFAKTKIIPDNDFDWGDDDFVSPKDPRDLIIYETHIKDLVAHPSAKTFAQGIYNDFREAQVGGIAHLKRLGVNAVEFLPLQKFAYFEPPFNQQIEGGVTNTWNAFSKNYWGYMTSFFFSPETIFASDGTLEEKEVVGRSDNAIKEFKQLVKSLHKEGISVIMDVVYNHASQYDLNPLRYAAKNHYFRINDSGNYLNDSWTGNDLNTANPNTRQLIIESVKYWMTEFHVDGFRFDLAGIIDWETIDLIKKEAQKINPNVLLIAEPWGGEYKPAGFSEHGWISWNDRLRNGIKGYDPIHNKGILFGEWHHGNSRFSVENFIRGTLVNAEQGLFQHSGHSLNYLESHDGYTLGDFIRIALNPSNIDRVYKKKASATRLHADELKVSKLAALTLFVSQGITMMHAGQEWARAKVVADTSGKEKNVGLLDRDSYNKDNETNWLNFNEINLNKELFEYYLGLIEFRKNAPAFRKAQPEEVNFKVYNNPLHITFSISGESTNDPFDYFISLNANPKKTHRIQLPEGKWELIIDSKEVDLKGIKIVQDVYQVLAVSGCVLRKLRVNDA